MDTGLIRVPLTELRTNDEQTIGTEYTEGGKTYRWVKNIGDTALVAAGCCLQPGSSKAEAFNKYVVAPDAATAKSAIRTMAAGSPMAAIIASGGASSNCFGWVQVKGPKRVTVMFSTLALIPGMLVIPSSGNIGTALTGKIAAWHLPGATAVDANAKFARVMHKVAANSASYGLDSCMCEICCA